MTSLASPIETCADDQCRDSTVHSVAMRVLRDLRFAALSDVTRGYSGLWVHRAPGVALDQTLQWFLAKVGYLITTTDFKLLRVGVDSYRISDKGNDVLRKSLYLRVERAHQLACEYLVYLITTEDRIRLDQAVIAAQNRIAAGKVPYFDKALWRGRQ